jgi:hypothetical protein
MKEGIECSCAKVDLEPVTDLKVNFVPPPWLTLEEPEYDEVEMVLHKSLSPCFIEILVQAALEPFETYNPKRLPLNAF